MAGLSRQLGKVTAEKEDAERERQTLLDSLRASEQVKFDHTCSPTCNLRCFCTLSALAATSQALNGRRRELLKYLLVLFDHEPIIVWILVRLIKALLRVECSAHYRSAEQAAASVCAWCRSDFTRSSSANSCSSRRPR